MCPPTSPSPLPQKFLYMSQGLSFLSPVCEISPKLVEIFLQLKRLIKLVFYGASSVYNISVVEKTFLGVGFSSISNI
jgi:hypothetical protein